MPHRTAPEPPRTLNRRDFLRLRTQGRQRVVELSCERLYVRYTDAVREAASGGVAAAESDPWIGGEPPARLDRPGLDELFAGLRHDTRHAHLVRVHGSEWLMPGRLHDEVHAMLDECRARGGHVRFADPPDGGDR